MSNISYDNTIFINFGSFTTQEMRELEIPLIPFTRQLVVHYFPQNLSEYVVFGNFTVEETTAMGFSLVTATEREISHKIPASSNIILFGELTIKETLSLSDQLLEIRNPTLICERCNRINHTRAGCFAETRLDGTEICDFVIEVDETDYEIETPCGNKFKYKRLGKTLKNLYYITNYVLQSHASFHQYDYQDYYYQNACY